jgi:hypothetical protein
MIGSKVREDERVIGARDSPAQREREDEADKGVDGLHAAGGLRGLARLDDVDALVDVADLGDRAVDAVVQCRAIGRRELPLVREVGLEVVEARNDDRRPR